MSDGTARDSREGSVRLPLTLILLTIAGLAALAGWLVFAPPKAPAPPPSVRISLGPSEAAPQDGAAAGAEKPAASSTPDRAPPRPEPAPAAPRPVPEAPPPPVAGSGPPLSPAPDQGLVEASPHGALPIVGRDGREAWRVYARPFDKDEKRPRIAVLLAGLGMNRTVTRAAIADLPGAVSLAFSPYAEGLDGWIANARAAGHEALMMLPMEAADFPISDPGPRALLTSLSEAQNIDRLEWALGRGAGYVGVTELLGSRFTSSTHHMNTLFQALKKRGLMFLASHREAAELVREIAKPLGLPYAVSALDIDKRATRSLIDAQLAELERLAGSYGQAIGTGSAYPITIERLAQWVQALDGRGFVLAPISALAKRTEP